MALRLNMLQSNIHVKGTVHSQFLLELFPTQNSFDKNNR